MKGTFVIKYETVKNGFNWEESLIESRETDDVQNDLYESRLFPQGSLQNSTACPVPRSLRR